MKKRDFFLLILVALFTTVFVINNRRFFLNQPYGKGNKLIEKSYPFLVSALQKGNEEVLNRVYRNLSQLDYPVALFNLTMDPVVWNDSALNYTGDYIIIKTVDILGNPIGYVGVGDSKEKNKGINYLHLWVFVLVLFFIISFSSFKPLHIGYLFLLIVVFAFSGEFLPIVLFFSLLYIKYGKKFVPEGIASIVFFLFAAVSFYNLLKTPFVFYDLITFFKTADFFQWFFVLILSSTFFLMLNRTIYALIVVVLSVFFGLPVFVFSLFLFSISFIKGRRISVFLLKLLVFSIFLIAFGHFYSHYKVQKFVEKSDFSYGYLKKAGEKKVKQYLKLAETRGFANLKDFVLRSGLKNEDYFVAYINVLGEVVESYSNNLPAIFEIGKNISFSKITLGENHRFVVSGSGRFKVGKIVIAVASDVYSTPFIKRHPEIKNFLVIKDENKGFSVHVKGINYFYFVSDLATAFIIGIIFFLVFSSAQKKKGLFERVIFSIYLGFSVIFIILGLFLFIFSNKIASKTIEKNVAENLKRIENLIEKEPSGLSTDYLQWLKDVFGVNIGIYGNGVLQLSTDRVNLSLLMPFPVFNKIKWGGRGIYFSKGVAYKSLNLTEIPFPAICVKGERDLNPLYEFLRIVAFVFFVVFLVSYFVSFEITKTLVSPLVELSIKARGVVKGNFEVSVDYQEDDEIKQLIDSISYMATSLKENYERLKAIIDNVSSAIVLLYVEGNIVISNRAFDVMKDELKDFALKETEKSEFDFNDRHFAVYRKEIGENLKMVVVEDLTEVIKASKLEVIADMAKKVAHDIKNPLTPIKLNIDYLLTVLKKKGKDIEEVLPQVANNIFLKIEELKNISSQFSNLFKASKDLNFEEIDVREFLEKTAESYPGVEFKISGKGVKITASRLKLARVFENLIENSLSFSPNPEISISIEEEGDIVKIDFKDNGSGIDEKNLEKIFEPYFSTREDGTGLGLFIVKEFVEEMGGEIKAYPSKKGGHFELKFRKNNS